MQLLRSRRFKWAAFITVDILLAITVVSLLWLRVERNEVAELRDLGTTVYPAPRSQVSDFRLLDQNGESFTADRLRGQWSLVFFGFTNCPNVCPLSMLELSRFYERLLLETELEPPQVIMATVDPGRDTPARMTEYLSDYNQDFIGLSGDAGQLQELARQLYVYMADNEAESANSDDHAAIGHNMAANGGEQAYGISATMMTAATSSAADHSEHDMSATAAGLVADSEFGHSAHITVIDPDGQVHAVMRLPHRAERLLAAYQRLIES